MGGRGGAGGGSNRADRQNKVVSRAQARIDALMRDRNFVRMDDQIKKPVPTGKNVTLYHWTTPERANEIARNGFRSKNVGAATKSYGTYQQRFAFFTLPQAHAAWSGYGKALVKVTVPRKMMSKDRKMGNFYPAPVKVRYSDLRGVKVTRVK